MRYARSLHVQLASEFPLELVARAMETVDNRQQIGKSWLRNDAPLTDRKGVNTFALQSLLPRGDFEEWQCRGHFGAVLG